MNAPLPAALAADWRNTLAALREQFPDADDQTLFDTCDGLTDAADVVAALVRQSIEAGAMAEANSRLMDLYASRSALMEEREKKLRSAALRLMEDMGASTIRRPEFTLSVSHRKGRPEVYDEEALPEEFFTYRTIRQVDKNKLAAAAEAGTLPAGARMTNGSSVLTVRTK